MTIILIHSFLSYNLLNSHRRYLRVEYVIKLIGVNEYQWYPLSVGAARIFCFTYRSEKINIIIRTHPSFPAVLSRYFY